MNNAITQMFGELGTTQKTRLETFKEEENTKINIGTITRTLIIE